jgi:hypothetical protein
MRRWARWRRRQQRSARWPTRARTGLRAARGRMRRSGTSRCGPLCLAAPPRVIVLTGLLQLSNIHRCMWDVLARACCRLTVCLQADNGSIYSEAPLRVKTFLPTSAAALTRALILRASWRSTSRRWSTTGRWAGGARWLPRLKTGSAASPSAPAACPAGACGFHHVPLPVSLTLRPCV